MREEPYSNLNTDVDYPDWYFSYFYSVSPGILRDRLLKQATTVFFSISFQYYEIIRDLLPSVLRLWRLLSFWIWRIIFGNKFIKASKEPAALFFRVAVILVLVVIIYPCVWRGRGRPLGKAVKKLGLFTRSRTTNYPTVMFAERYSCSLYVISMKAIVL
jgi:hypothetical protein